MNEPKHTVPSPDPTRLTTEYADKAILSAREILEAKLACMKDDLRHHNERLDDGAKHIAAGVAHLEKLHDEKFKSIQTQFAERDTRTDKTAELNQKAIDTAMAAAEKSRVTQNETSDKAIAKSEASFTKQIDAQAGLIATVGKGLEDKINEIRERLGRNEGKDNGQVTAVTNRHASGNYMIAIIGLILSTVIGAAAIIIAIVLKTP